MVVDTHLKVNVTDSNPFPCKPVAMEDLVRVAIEGELVKGGVHHGDLAQDGGAGADDAVVKEVMEGERVPGQSGDGDEVLWTPDLQSTNQDTVFMSRDQTSWRHTMS